MLHLYIIRHADAVPHGDPNYADDDRPLTEKGQRQSEALGRALVDHDVRFDLILCSPLPRAQQTVEGLLAGMADPKPPVEYAVELAPGLKPKKLDRAVLKHDAGAIALVGHQPDLGRYVGRLIGSKKACVDLAKPSVACVACADPPGKRCGSLVCLISPEWFGGES
jgi:phosphohistidine phosphatase